MANKIKYGLSEVHVAFIGAEGYEAPIAIPGAVNMELDAEGGETSFYADNKKYFNQKKNDGYSGTLEMALFPDAVKARMLGDYIDSDGNYVEDADGKPTSFALLFQIEGDVKARRTVLYEVTGSRPSEGGETSEDTIEPNTETMDITAVPHRFETIGKNVPKLTAHEDEASYAGFFTAVVEPKAAAAAGGE